MGILDMSAGNGTANTSLVYHAGRLLALHEGDMPYQVRVNENVCVVRGQLQHALVNKS